MTTHADPRLYLSYVLLERLSDELIGWRIKSNDHCPNNRLLQTPRVIVERLQSRYDDSVNAVMVSSDSDNDSKLHPAADLIQTISSESDCSDEETAMRFFRPELFQNVDPEEDPLYLGNTDTVADDKNLSRRKKKMQFRYSATVMHGIATKHLDQMTQMSPATSFSTDPDEIEENTCDGPNSNSAEFIDMVPDSLESCTGTE